MARYYSTARDLLQGEETIEDTMENDDDACGVNDNHRHFDQYSENTLPGQKFNSRGQGLEPYSRRNQGRLAVSRVPYIEPLGAKRSRCCPWDLFWVRCLLKTKLLAF